MAEYASDTDGAVICVDCLHGGCVIAGPCEADACMCECNADAETVGQLHDRVVAAGGVLHDYGYRFSTADRPVPAQFLPSTGG